MYPRTFVCRWWRVKMLRQTWELRRRLIWQQVQPLRSNWYLYRAIEFLPICIQSHKTSTSISITQPCTLTLQRPAKPSMFHKLLAAAPPFFLFWVAYLRLLNVRLFGDTVRPDPLLFFGWGLDRHLPQRSPMILIADRRSPYRPTEAIQRASHRDTIWKRKKFVVLMPTMATNKVVMMAHTNSLPHLNERNFLTPQPRKSATVKPSWNRFFGNSCRAHSCNM